jgi:hypothetical protein
MKLDDLKPQDKPTVKQVQDIRSVTGVGVMKAKKLALQLNKCGHLTWAMVHSNDYGIIEDGR